MKTTGVAQPSAPEGISPCVKHTVYSKSWSGGSLNSHPHLHPIRQTTKSRDISILKSSLTILDFKHGPAKVLPLWARRLYNRELEYGRWIPVLPSLAEHSLLLSPQRLAGLSGFSARARLCLHVTGAPQAHTNLSSFKPPSCTLQ